MMGSTAFGSENVFAAIPPPQFETSADSRKRMRIDEPAIHAEKHFARTAQTGRLQTSLMEKSGIHQQPTSSPQNPSTTQALQGLQRPVEVISLLDSDDDGYAEPERTSKKRKGSGEVTQQSMLQNASASMRVSPSEGLYLPVEQPSTTSSSLSFFAPHRSGQEKSKHSSSTKPSQLPNASASDALRQTEVTDVGKKQQKDAVALTEPILSTEQSELVDLIMSGRNVFYTGSAGCGKSTVLKAFTKRFRDMGRNIHIIAPTGRAALDINGSTTWTYAGWTPDHHKRPLKTLLAAAHGKFVRKRLHETDVLVIDEISMVENLHFERLNRIMQEARNNKQAFGGVQLIVTGDFCQLPPVKPFQHCMECGKELIANAASTTYKCREHGLFYDIDKWAFRSEAWQKCNFAHVELKRIHRQKDEVFIKILQKCRRGQALSQVDTDLLLNHTSSARNAVKLYATREEVKRINQEEFKNLLSRERFYQCLDHFNWNEKHRHLESKNARGVDGSFLSLRDHKMDAQLHLKQGMRVVLLVNLDINAGLVNGSQGVIQGFEKYDPKKLPRASENARNAMRKRNDDDNSSKDEPQVLSGDHAMLREHQIRIFISESECKEWPIVQFLNGQRRTIYADCTVNELGDEKPYTLLSRTQIPLMAAWAMSIHKSQGMTLNRVIVDLSKSFEEGQMYVALSRATSLEGLKVEGLGRGMGRGNQQVKEFLAEHFGD